MKIYYCSKSITCLLIVYEIALIIGGICDFIFFKIYTFCLFGIVALLSFFVFLRSDMFTPIYIFHDNIRFKDKSYKWKNLLIVAMPTKTSPIQDAYDLWFVKDTIFDISIDTLKSEKICKVALTKSNLDTILSHYKKKVFVFDRETDQFINKLKTSRKLKQKIETHNSMVIDK